MESEARECESHVLQACSSLVWKRCLRRSSTNSVVMFSRAPESGARGCATESQPNGLRIKSRLRALHRTCPLHVSGNLGTRKYSIVSVGGHRGTGWRPDQSISSGGSRSGPRSRPHLYTRLWKPKGGSDEERDVGGHFRKRISIGLGRVVIDGGQTMAEVGREILGSQKSVIKPQA